MTSRFLLAAAFLATPLFAQTPSDADALADQVRRLGASPNDMDALLRAATLEVRLDDLAAASVFLARAEKASPGDPRIRAGEGAVLVRSERPAEALRRFAEAERGGVPVAAFASDRGLAWDLLGDPGRAQRDYRAALAAQPDEETRRRYALSLGIAGQQSRALAELDPLTRANDRGAWRARAFVLAMAGDQAEAARIAATMMPPGAAGGLASFFAQLPTLPAADRAFAVHFGEVHPTPARLADARLAPAQAPLPVEPEPVRVAAVAAPPPTSTRKKRKDKDVPPPVIVTYAPPPAQPPAYQAPAYTPPPAYRAPVALAVNDRPLSAGEQASLRAAGLRTPPARRGGRAVTGVVAPVVSAGTLSAAEQASLAAASGEGEGQREGRRSRRTQVAATLPVVTAPSPGFSTPATMPVPASPPLAVAAPTPVPAPAVASAALPASTRLPDPATTAVGPPVRIAAVPSSPPVSSPPVSSSPVSSSPVLSSPGSSLSVPSPPVSSAAVVAPPRAFRPPARSRAQADTILARIVAGLSIPASELGVAEPAAPGNRRSRATRVADQVATAVPDDTPPAGRRTHGTRVGDAVTTPAPDDAATARAAARDRKAAAAKLTADRKAAADKKAAALQEAADRKAARAEPSRIWVQVAGGANEASLPAAWAVTKGKAPAAFAGHKAYTTPLRATNRVLTGPFKTDAEARAYVNQLAKAGVPAFTFTSDAGQKVSRLGEK